MNECGIWVDTDVGFDDLWALFLLQHLHIKIDGVSLVHGNASLVQICQNAASAIEVFGFNWPVYCGESTPLKRPVQTAANVLGPTGMRTRGRHLPQASEPVPVTGNSFAATGAFKQWLTQPGQHKVLALGPLTNLAVFLNHRDIDVSRVDRITWLGGSAGRGNHTAQAEFNAACDPEAVAMILASGLAVDIIDLEFCRQVQFDQLPDFLLSANASHAQLILADLLGGYLDIALERGRAGMNIYDPLAALTLGAGTAIEYQRVDVHVELHDAEHAGGTRFTHNPESRCRLAISTNCEHARALCLEALNLSFDKYNTQKV